MEDIWPSAWQHNSLWYRWNVTRATNKLPLTQSYLDICHQLNTVSQICQSFLSEQHSMSNWREPQGLVYTMRFLSELGFVQLSCCKLSTIERQHLIFISFFIQLPLEWKSENLKDFFDCIPFKLHLKSESNNCSSWGCSLRNIVSTMNDWSPDSCGTSLHLKMP